MSSISGLLEYNKNLLHSEEKTTKDNSIGKSKENHNNQNKFKIGEQEGIEAFLAFVSKKLDNIM